MRSVQQGWTDGSTHSSKKKDENVTFGKIKEVASFNEGALFNGHRWFQGPQDQGYPRMIQVAEAKFTCALARVSKDKSAQDHSRVP